MTHRGEGWKNLKPGVPITRNDTSEGRRIRVQRCQAMYENERTRNTLRATRRIITHCTNRPTFKTKARKGVIAVEIHTSLCSPRRVFAVLPKVLLLSYPTVPTLTLSSPGPEQRIRSHQITITTMGTFCCCLWSLRTSSTSSVNVSKPSLWYTFTKSQQLDCQLAPKGETKNKIEGRP